MKGIEGNDYGHHHHVFRVGGIAQGTTDGGKGEGDGGNKANSHGEHGGEGRGIDAGRGGFIFTVDESEERGLHAEGENDEEEGSIAVNLRHNAVATACRRDFGRVERYEQIVQKAADDAAQAVDGRVFGQRFQGCHNFGGGGGEKEACICRMMLRQRLG